MPIHIFNESTTFNPTDYGLKSGDSVNVITVGGGGGGGGGTVYVDDTTSYSGGSGGNGGSSSFGSYTTALGGFGGFGGSTKGDPTSTFAGMEAVGIVHYFNVIAQRNSAGITGGLFWGGSSGGSEVLNTDLTLVGFSKSPGGGGGGGYIPNSPTGGKGGSAILRYPYSNNATGISSYDGGVSMNSSGGYGGREYIYSSASTRPAYTAILSAGPNSSGASKSSNHATSGEINSAMFIGGNEGLYNGGGAGQACDAITSNSIALIINSQGGGGSGFGAGGGGGSGNEQAFATSSTSPPPRNEMGGTGGQSGEVRFNTVVLDTDSAISISVGAGGSGGSGSGPASNGITGNNGSTIGRTLPVMISGDRHTMSGMGGYGKTPMQDGTGFRPPKTPNAQGAAAQGFLPRYGGSGGGGAGGCVIVFW